MIHRIGEGELIRKGLNYRWAGGPCLILSTGDTHVYVRLRLSPLRLFFDVSRRGDDIG